MDVFSRLVLKERKRGEDHFYQLMEGRRQTRKRTLAGVKAERAHRFICSDEVLRKKSHDPRGAGSTGGNEGKRKGDQQCRKNVKGEKKKMLPAIE